MIQVHYFTMLPELELFDHVRLRKAHPCGGYEWKVLRLGADIKIECLTCGRQVMLTRRELARRTKIIISQHGGANFPAGSSE